MRRKMRRREEEDDHDDGDEEQKYYYKQSEREVSLRWVVTEFQKLKAAVKDSDSDAADRPVMFTTDVLTLLISNMQFLMP